MRAFARIGVQEQKGRPYTMATSQIKVLALDLDGTLTNDEKKITPAPGSPAGGCRPGNVTPGAGLRPADWRRSPAGQRAGIGQDRRMHPSYNGGAILDCRSGQVPTRNCWTRSWCPSCVILPPSRDVAIVTYDAEHILTERPDDRWAQWEGFYQPPAGGRRAGSGRPCKPPGAQNAHHPGPGPPGRGSGRPLWRAVRHTAGPLPFQRIFSSRLCR